MHQRENFIKEIWTLEQIRKVGQMRFNNPISMSQSQKMENPSNRGKRIYLQLAAVQQSWNNEL